MVNPRDIAGNTEEEEEEEYTPNSVADLWKNVLLPKTNSYRKSVYCNVFILSRSTFFKNYKFVLLCIIV